MQFNPAAGKAHTVVPPGHSCYGIPPWLSAFTGRTLRACSAECSRGTGCTRQPQRSSPTPGALVACQLTTASMNLNWELKGYTMGFSADVQTLSIILPVLCRKNASILHTRPKRKRLHYSHLAGSACRSSYILSPVQGSLLQYHASYVSFSLLSSREGA